LQAIAASRIACEQAPTFPAMADTPPETNVLDTWLYYSDAPNAFYKYFTDDAFARLAERKAVVGALASRADWESYQRKTRATLAEVVGAFPEKTPLNPRVTGVVQKPGYRIEKVIYESQPGFHVTAALFVPEGLKGKAPAILYCSGHSDGGFRTPSYMTMIVNLVKKGFVVLAFDPIGQGERWQYFDAATGRNDFGNGNSTREHTRVGSQCFLVGDSLARHMIWDGIRGVDYLLTRAEVDPARLGITGRSGGGTQTAYIAAFDERLKAAAPENYLTEFEQLLRTRGPQDPEQNFFRGIARGLNQTDLLHVRAPKPALVVATTRDIFSIEGTQAVFAEAQRAYTALGQADAVAMTVDDAGHESTRKNREATYAFFRQYLDHPGSTVDEPNDSLRVEDLRITETGQVMTALRGESAFGLNAKVAAGLQAKLDERRRDLPRHLAQVKTEAARLAGYVPGPAAQAVVFSGRTQRSGYAVEKYLLPVDERYAIPVLVMVPAAAPTRVVLYLHGDGKGAEAKPGGEMEALVKQGCAVIAPDVLGTGELGPGPFGAHGDDAPRLWYGFVLLGQSEIGRQMRDVMRTVRFAESRFRVAAAQLHGVARGASGPLLLHTAALEDVFGHVVVLDAPFSYRAIVAVPRYKPAYIAGAVPGALTAYDLPDLAACLAPRSLLFVAPRDGRGEPADAGAIERDSAVIQSAYAAKSAAKGLVVVREADRAAAGRALEAWLK
jgi:cephalosporin-C deacetylase-like acetyl esterase